MFGYQKEKVVWIFFTILIVIKHIHMHYKSTFIAGAVCRNLATFKEHLWCSIKGQIFERGKCGEIPHVLGHINVVIQWYGWVDNSVRIPSMVSTFLSLLSI